MSLPARQHLLLAARHAGRLYCDYLPLVVAFHIHSHIPNFVRPARTRSTNEPGRYSSVSVNAYVALAILGTRAGEITGRDRLYELLLGLSFTIGVRAEEVISQKASG